MLFGMGLQYGGQELARGLRRLREGDNSAKAQPLWTKYVYLFRASAFGVEAYCSPVASWT